MNIEKRNMVIFCSGTLISGLGTMIYNFAIGLYVLEITKSSINFSITLILGILPKIIFSPIAGCVADRFSRKKLIVITDLICSLLMFLVFFFSKYYSLSLLIIYLTTFLLSLFNTFFSVNIISSLPNLVSKKELLKINSLNSMSLSIVRIAGPLLGGVFYGLFDVDFIPIFNGISFLISALLECFLTFNQTKIENYKKVFFKEIKEAFIYIKEKKTILSVIKYSMFINFFIINLSILIPYFCIEKLKISSSQFGITQMGLPLGMIISSLFYSFKSKENKDIFKKVLSVSIAVGVCHLLLLFPLFVNFSIEIKLVLIFSIVLFVGIFMTFIDIPLETLLQNLIEDECRGRVVGLLNSLCQIISPLSIFFFGLLVDKFPLFYTIILSSFAFFSISFILSKEKKLLII